MPECISNSSERQSVYQRSYRDRIVEDNKLTAEAGTESLHSVALEASQHLASAFGQQSRLHFDTPSPLKPNTHAAAHLMAGTQEDEEDQPSQAHDHAPPGALRGKLKPSPPPHSPLLTPTPLQSAPASRLAETWGRAVLSTAAEDDKMVTHEIAGVSGEVVSGFDAKISSCVTLCNALRSQLVSLFSLFHVHAGFARQSLLVYCYKAYVRGCRTPTCWRWRPPRALTPTSTQDQPSVSCSTDTLSRTWYGARQSRRKHFDIIVSVPASLLVCHT